MVMHLLLKYGDTSGISFSKRNFPPPGRPTFKLMKLELDEKSSLYVVCMHFLLLLKNITKGLKDLFLAALKIEMQR